MAVNLTATARLRTGPFMKSLAAVTAAVQGLHTADIAGATKADNANKKRIKTVTAAGQAYAREAQQAASSTASRSRGIAQLTALTASQVKEVDSLRKVQDDIVRQTPALTSAQARQETAFRAREAALRDIVRLEGQGVTSGAQFERAQDKLANANTRYAKAVNDVAAETAKAQRVSRAAASSTASRSRGIAQSTALTASQVSELDRLRKVEDDIIRQTPALTSAQARQETAFRAREAALRDIVRLEGQGVTSGAQFERAQDKLANARTRYANAVNDVAAETAKAQRVSRANAEAQNQLAKAQRLANTETTNFTRSLNAMSPAQLKAAQAANSLRIAQEGLNRSLVKSGGAITPAVMRQQSAVMGAQAQVSRLAAAQQAAATSGGSLAGTLNSQRYLMHDLSRQAGMAALAFAALPAVTIGVAAAWEQSFMNVARTADPAFSAVESRVEGLRGSLVQLAQTMPMAFGSLSEIATLANQMGIASTQTADFTRAVAMFSATSGVAVDMTATAFGRLTSILGDNAIGFNQMADSILKVGVNSVATEDEIINVTTQISSIAAQAGFSAEEMIGLSGAMASVRVPPELSRGVVTRVFGQISRAVADGGSDLENFARISGVTSEEFKRSWGTDQAGAVFTSFMQGLHKLGPAAEAELRNLGITSVRDVPVLLRLSSAADSEGNVGQLLTQTMNDAHNAAGETQRQYGMMADTLISKFKVLGNNILAFFDAVGSGGLGPVGNIVEGFSDGLRNLTRNLDSSIIKIGDFNITLGDLIGTGLVVATAVAGLAALGGILAKVGAGFAALKAAGPAVRSLMGLGAAAPAIGKAAVSIGGVATASGALAGSGKLAGSALAGFGKAALGVVGRIGAVGIAIELATSAVGWFIDAYRDGGTEVDKLSQQLADIKISEGVVTNMEEFDKIFNNLEVRNFGKGGENLWDSMFGTSKVISDGVAGYREMFREIETFEKKQYAGLKDLGKGGIAVTTDSSFDSSAAINRAEASVRKVGKAFDGLVEAGNAAQAISLISEFGLTTAELDRQLKSAPELDSYISNLLEINDIDPTVANKAKLIAGGFADISNALYDIEGFTSVFTDLGLDADDAGEAVGAFISTIDEASAAFVDISSNFERSMDESGNFSGQKFMENLRQGVEDQGEWVKGLQQLAQTGSAAFIQELAALGPAGAEAIKFFAGNPEAFAEAEALWKEGSSKLVGGFIANIIAAEHWATSNLGDSLSSTLSKALSDAEMEQVYAAGRDVSANLLKEITEAFLSEEIDFPTMLEQLQEASELDMEVEIKAKAEGGAELRAELERHLGEPIEAEVEFNKMTTIGELREILDDPDLLPAVKPHVSLEQAAQQYDTFRAWAQAHGILTQLDADAEPARMTVAALKAQAEGTIMQAQLDALPNLAQNAIWDVVQLADGSTGFVQVDADSGEAVSEIAYVVDEAGRSVGTVPLTANEVEAIKKINGVKTTADETVGMLIIDADSSDAEAVLQGLSGRVTYSTHVIQVMQQRFSDKAIEYGARDGDRFMADGGMLSFYADGGINSKHVAQIAPAGAMRVWAEPETEGEAYIPFARSKRSRSVAILDQVAQRFGYSLSNATNVARFADGGQYMAQAMSRQRFAVTQPTSGVGGAGINIGPVTFAQESQKDQFREFTRHVNRYARRGR